MSISVLRELEELRSLLDTPVTKHPGLTPRSPPLGKGDKDYGQALYSAEVSVDQQQQMQANFSLLVCSSKEKE